MPPEPTPIPLRFDEVSQAPNEPGVYAWYHQIQLNSGDIAKFRQRLQDRSVTERRELAGEFLMEHIFGPYREADYDVAIRGKLKPEYHGNVEHRPRLSESLFSAIADGGHALDELRGVLSRTVPFFASPIYIGLASRLRHRLTTHRRLINLYRETRHSEPEQTDSEDHSFAYEAVCVRRLLPSELIVYAMPLTSVSEQVVGAAEYILNRINYPLCGRN